MEFASDVSAARDRYRSYREDSRDPSSRARHLRGTSRAAEHVDEQGVRVGCKRVARLMRAASLQGLTPNRFVRITMRDGTNAATLLVSSGYNDSVLRYNAITGAFIDNFVSGGGLVDPAGLVFSLDGNLYVSSSTAPRAWCSDPTATST